MEYEREMCMGQEITMASRRPAALTHIEQDTNVTLYSSRDGELYQKFK